MMNFFPLLSKISKISTLADYFTPGDRGASQFYNDDKDSLSIMYNIQGTIIEPVLGNSCRAEF